MKSLSNQKIDDFFKDVDGNIFALTSKKAIQLYITDSAIYRYPEEEKSKFKYLIENKLYAGENTLVFSEILEETFDYEHLNRTTGMAQTYKVTYPHLHHCGSTLYVIEDNGKKRTIYQTIDSSRYHLTSEVFLNYMSAYVRFSNQISEGYATELDSTQYRQGTYKSIKHFYDKQYAIKWKDYFLYLPGIKNFLNVRNVT